MIRRTSILLAALLAPLLIVAPANSDTVYQPPSGTFNGHVIYISPACHDRGTGSCHTNYGCGGAGGTPLNENKNARRTAKKTTYDTNTGADLLARGYRVVIGNGLLQENINNSNARPNVSVHLALHSNAAYNQSCTPRSKSTHGTEGLYRYSNTADNPNGTQRNCAQQLKLRVGPAGPGTRDKKIYRTNLGELNYINRHKAVTCYLESEYHDVNRGVNFLRDRKDWAWRIGYSIDMLLDYP